MTKQIILEKVLNTINSTLKKIDNSIANSSSEDVVTGLGEIKTSVDNANPNTNLAAIKASVDGVNANEGLIAIKDALAGISENNQNLKSIDATLRSIYWNKKQGETFGNVRFIDYDGTILKTYSKEEFAALDILPANPVHEGLIAQGWNWTLENAKVYVAKYGKLDIGQMYITDDGATKLEILLVDNARLTVPLHFSQTVSEGVSVDWGDGSAAETVTGTGSVDFSHTYAASGNYIIKLTPADNCTLSIGYPSIFNNSTIYAYRNSLRSMMIGKNVTSIGAQAFYYCFSLASITIPDSVTSIGGSAFYYCFSLASITIPDSVTSIGGSTFAGCSSLASITIPDSVTSIGNQAFESCGSLASITIPDGVTSIGNSAFAGCVSLASITIPDSVTSIENSAFDGSRSLASITIPDSVTSIGNSAFGSCVSLASITIPDSVTSIGNQAFSGCFSLGVIRFKPNTPPAVANVNAWTNVPTDCKILVPAGTLAAYTSAANYPSSSSYTYEEY